MSERTTCRTVRKGMSDYYWRCTFWRSESYSVMRKLGPKCADKYDPQAPLTFADYQRARDTLAGIVRDEFDFETVWP